MRIRTSAVAILIAVLLASPAFAQESGSPIDDYANTPASLLDLFFEATKQRIDHANLINDGVAQRILLRQELLGEKYRARLPQKDLDVHYLFGSFRAATVPNRFTASYDVFVSPYHSVLKQKLEDDAAYAKFFGQVVKEACADVRAKFTSATSSLRPFKPWEHQRFEDEVAAKTRLDVGWHLFGAKDTDDGRASDAAKALASRGVCVRCFYCRCQQVPAVGKQPPEIKIEFRDFRSMEDLAQWDGERHMKDAQQEFQEWQQATQK